MKILIAETESFSDEATAITRQAGQVDKIDICAEDIAWAFENYDVIWFRLGFRISEKLLRRPGSRVSVIVCPVTGLDHIDTKTCGELGIEVISLKGEVEFLKSVRATAEMTIGLTLALLRKIPQAFKSVKKGEWERDNFKGSEIFGKTVGIIGMGRLGKIVADYFLAFGAKVIAFDVKDFHWEGVRKATTLTELLNCSDIVSLHVSYDKSTHHLINKEAFQNFKKGSILVNTARGSIVDTDGLIEALQSGLLGGAALDVIENEHEVQKSKLITYANQFENLLITPHLGGNTTESFAKTEVFIAQKLINFLSKKVVWE